MAPGPLTNLAQRYERVPYPGQPFAALHPERLAATARLFGLRTAPVERCRVLEIGCAGGAHLIPMAAQLPGSAFLGVDLAAAAVATAREQAKALGLGNIRFENASFTDLPAEASYDYIVVHGVYSWIDAAQRSALLAFCRQRLTERGVAMVSYNTLPGWYLRGLARGVMRLFPAAGGPDAEVIRARALLGWAATNVPAGAPHATILRDEQEMVARATDAYLFHEHLAPCNDPLWFSDFVGEAVAAGLRYVGEVRLADFAPDRLGSAVAAAVAAVADDLIVREQLMDVLQPRYFRRSLLCHRERDLSRRVSWRQLGGLRFVASDGQGRLAQLAAGSPAAALGVAADALLAERAPQSVSFDGLLARAAASAEEAISSGELLGELLISALARGELEAVVRRWPLRLRAGARPRASPLARWQAAAGQAWVTNQRHESIAVDAVDRLLLAHLDGRSTRTALAGHLAAAGGDPGGHGVGPRLDSFARNALIV